MQANETMASPAVSRRIERLRARLHKDLAGLGGHTLTAAEDLRKAKAAPERYQDLIVRISGFSARFVKLDEKWQDAIIERTAHGM